MGGVDEYAEKSDMYPVWNIFGLLLYHLLHKGYDKKELHKHVTDFKPSYLFDKQGEHLEEIRRSILQRLESMDLLS